MTIAFGVVGWLTGCRGDEASISFSTLCLGNTHDGCEKCDCFCHLAVDPAERFLTIWNDWIDDDGLTTPLPKGRRTRVRSFVMLGVTTEQMREAVTDVMRRPGVTGHFNFFVWKCWSLLAPSRDEATEPILGVDDLAAWKENRRRQQEEQQRLAREREQAQKDHSAAAITSLGRYVRRKGWESPHGAGVYAEIPPGPIHLSTCPLARRGNPTNWEGFSEIPDAAIPHKACLGPRPHPALGPQPA